MVVHSFISNSETIMKKGLLRFGVAVFIVLTSVVMIDLVVGKTLDWMLPQISNQGATGKTYFSLYDVNTPVVIVGSSRASHHYVTQQVEDSIGLPAYNVARDGCFFSHNSCVVNSIIDRYNPKLIIWENCFEYLYEGVDDPFVNLYPYYGTNKWVTAAIKEELPWSEYARLNSKIYQYNSVIHRILMRYRSRNSYTEETEKGYEPLEPKKLIKKLELGPEKLTGTKLSETRLARFDSILSRAENKGIKMVIVDSPRYFIQDSINISRDKMEEISKKHGMLFIDNTHLPFFMEHDEMFADPTHMNSNGAEIYTELFLNQIHDYVSTIKN